MCFEKKIEQFLRNLILVVFTIVVNPRGGVTIISFTTANFWNQYARTVVRYMYSKLVAAAVLSLTRKWRAGLWNLFRVGVVTLSLSWHFFSTLILNKFRQKLKTTKSFPPYLKIGLNYRWCEISMSLVYSDCDEDYATRRWIYNSIKKYLM